MGMIAVEQSTKDAFDTFQRKINALWDDHFTQDACIQILLDCFKLNAASYGEVHLKRKTKTEK